MKKSKSKTKPAETSAAKPAWEEDFCKQYDELPTTEQLTMIAATLAGGANQNWHAFTNYESKDSNADALADASLNLWYAARKHRANAGLPHQKKHKGDLVRDELLDLLKYLYSHQVRPYFREEFRWATCGPLGPNENQKPVFRVTRDEFLRVVLPQYAARADILAKIAKAYLRYELCKMRNGKEPTKNEVDAAYGRLPTFENAYDANQAAHNFIKWHQQYVNETRRAAGLKSAEKKAALKNAAT